MIRNALKEDAAVLAEIYNHYILNTTANFELEAISAEVMWSRIAEVQQSLPWLLLEENGFIAGYAYASKWKSRSGYRKTVEISVYLDREHCGKGFGSLLYDALISKLQILEIHSAIGGIALPNDSSIRLHEKFGFEKVAHFKEVGYKMGKWIDVGYWQRIF